MARRRPNDKILEKWKRKEADYEKLVNDLEKENDRLRKVIDDNFHPKSFDINECPAKTICPLGDCEKLNVNCKLGKEKDCTLCENFRDREKCDNWGWYNCTLVRMQARYGKDVYEKEFKRVCDASKLLKETKKEVVSNGSVC